MSNNIPVNGWPQLKDLEAVQPILNRLDKIEAWKRTVKEETFTGDDITIENALALPARSLITEINAIQDLHGLPFPYVGGAYKNKVETPSATAFAACGITLTTASNGETTLNGTSTAGSIDGDTFELPAGTYTISVGTTLPSGVWVSLDGVGGAMISPTAKSISFTTTEAINTFTHIYVNAGVAFNNFKLNWMLESGSTATSFAPYSNICPISGRTAATITRSKYGMSFVQGGLQDNTGAEVESNSRIRTDYIPLTDSSFTLSMENGENDDVLRNSIYLYDAQKHFIATKQYGLNPSTFPVNVNIDIPTNTAYMRFVVQKSDATANISPSNRVMTVNPTNFTIQLGTTVYGAEVDFNEGAAEVTDGYIASYDGETLPSTWISDRDVYVVGTTPSIGAEVCYKLATPIELTLTPTEVQMLKGYNRVTLSDGYGTIELKALTGANWS